MLAVRKFFRLSAGIRSPLDLVVDKGKKRLTDVKETSAVSSTSLEKRPNAAEVKGTTAASSTSLKETKQPAVEDTSSGGKERLLTKSSLADLQDKLMEERKENVYWPGQTL